MDFTVVAASSSSASALTEAIPLDIQDAISGFVVRFNAVSSVKISEAHVVNVLCADSSGSITSCATLTSSPTTAPAQEEAAAVTVGAAVGAALGATIAGLQSCSLYLIRATCDCEMSGAVGGNAGGGTSGYGDITAIIASVQGNWGASMTFAAHCTLSGISLAHECALTMALSVLSVLERCHSAHSVALSTFSACAKCHLRQSAQHCVAHSAHAPICLIHVVLF